MQDYEARRELRLLAERLERIERWLGMLSAAKPPFVAPSETAADQPSSVPTDQFKTARGEVAPEAPPLAPPTAPPIAPPQFVWTSPDAAEKASLQRLQERVAEVREAASAQSLEPAAAEAAPPVASALAAPPIAAPPRVPKTSSVAAAERQPAPSLEFQIGGKWMAWVGAIVVVLAAAFLVKIGIDRGFWGKIPPTMRCLFIAGFGGLMLAAGEIALRRIGRAASVGLFGAGLGVMYLDAFATFRFFKIVSSEWAFALMAGVAIIGFAITLRTRFRTIGVLSLLGGYLTPILLRGQSTHDVELLMYLTMLLGIALGLAAVLPGDFRALRYLGLGGQIIIGLAWLLANSAQWQLGIVFMSVWWSMVLGEAVYSALRRLSPIGNVVVVLIATAAYVTAGCWILNAAPGTASNWLGLFTGMIAVIGAAVAMQFGPGLDGLRRAPMQAIDKLAMALWAQSGVLIVTAVALQFTGFGETIGWLAIALAAVECGRRLPSRGVSLFGLIVLALAAVRVLLLDWWVHRPRFMLNELVSFGDVIVNRWSLIALAAMLVIFACAHRLRAKAPGAVPVLLTAVGAFFWLILCESQAEGLATTAGWLLGCCALLALERFGMRQRYFEIALVMLTLTAGRWLALDAVMQRVNPHWSGADSLPVLNWQMGLAAMIALVGWWAYRLMRRREAMLDAAHAVVRASWQWVFLGGAVFGLVALSFEIDRYVARNAASGDPLWWSSRHLRQLLLTLLWTVGSSGIGLLALAMRGRDEHQRLRLPKVLVHFAWLTLGVCAVKWIALDTLAWLIVGRMPGSATGAAAALPVVNVQMLVGAAVAASLLVLINAGLWPRAFTAASSDSNSLDSPRDRVGWVPVASALLVLWGLSFEVDRAITRMGLPLPDWMAAWQPAQLRALFLTLLWAAGGAALLHIGRWRTARTMIEAGWALIALAAIAWLMIDTLAFRISHEPAETMVFFNLQSLTGVACAGLLLHASLMLLRRGRVQSDVGHTSRAGEYLHHAAQAGFALTALLILCIGTVEIDRLFAEEPMSQQTGFSVWWAIFGVLLVLLGFAKVSAAARYAGLGLLSITLVKVLIVDFSALDDLPRVISTAAAGLLFIATSLVYTKLSPRILAMREKSRAESTVYGDE